MRQFLPMKPLALGAAERSYFTAVTRAVVANPFSAERSAAERALDDGPERGRSERILGELAQRLARFGSEAGAPLARCAPAEREPLAHACLFALYHAWSPALDRAIA